MSIDKLSRLFSALGQSTQSYPSTSTKTEEVTVARAASSEAVKVSGDFQGVKESGDSSRSARIAEIKRQVSEGTYNPDRTAVAEAVARELFA